MMKKTETGKEINAIQGCIIEHVASLRNRVKSFSEWFILGMGVGNFSHWLPSSIDQILPKGVLTPLYFQVYCKQHGCVNTVTTVFQPGQLCNQLHPPV